jgi:hypothetical protein
MEMARSSRLENGVNDNGTGIFEPSPSPQSWTILLFWHHVFCTTIVTDKCSAWPERCTLAKLPGRSPASMQSAAITRKFRCPFLDVLPRNDADGKKCESNGCCGKHPYRRVHLDFLDIHAEHGRDKAQGNVDEGQPRQLVDLLRLLNGRLWLLHGLLGFQYAHHAQQRAGDRTCLVHSSGLHI